MAKSIRKLLKSFTLIELIIVIAIIAVLGATAFLLLTQWMSKGRDAQRISDLSTIKTALDIALSKNDILPLPDENSVLLYSGTEILYQGKFGDDVVKSIGTLNKVPRDRVNGEYGYSLLYDKKTYRVRAEIENEIYRMSYLSQTKASNTFYRYIGKDIKAVVVKDMFVYLPSMFITGYVNNEFDLYDSGFNVFVGERVGEFKSGFALPVNEIDDIKNKLGTLGLQENEINQIIAQGTGQPQIVTEEKCDGTLPTNADFNGPQKSGLSLIYSETSGECKFKCNQGYYYTGGNCEISKVYTGNATDGFRFYENGVQVYPKSCNDLIESENPSFKISGPWNGLKFEDGVYWIKHNANPAFKVYCDMTTDNGGWTLFGKITNASFSYASFRGVNYGIDNSVNNVVGLKPSGTTARLKVTGNLPSPFSFDIKESEPSGYFEISTGAIANVLIFNRVISSSNADVSVISTKPITFNTQLNYCSSNNPKVSFGGGSGIIIGGASYGPQGTTCLPGGNLRWSLIRSASTCEAIGAAGTSDNSMAIAVNKDCRPRPTGVVSNGIYFYYK